MSMICSLRRVDKEHNEHLLTNPDEILAFVEADVEIDNLPENEIDLDKAWHGIHYILTGEAWGGAEPFCYLVKGGREIGDVDVGYDTARAVMPAEVFAFRR